MNGAIKTVLILLAGAAGVAFFIDLAGRLVDGKEAQIGFRIPPYRVTLEPKDRPPWRNPQAVMLLSAKLEELGYEMTGEYVVPEIRRMKLRGFCHLEENLFGMVAEMRDSKVIVELMVWREDGTVVKAGNERDTGFELPDFLHFQRFDADLIKNPDAVKDFHEFLVDDSNSVPRGTVTSLEQFETIFEKDWARVMDWGVERRDLSEAEVRRVFSFGGYTNVSDRVVQITRRNWRKGMDEYTGRMPAD
ncbi:MAG: hypothetical protein ACPGVU_07990 [Limisphaerales bacterium]